MVYSPTGSSDLFLILGCMTSNLSYLSFSTLYSSSLWRNDTFVFSKLNKPPISIKLPLKWAWNKQAPRGLNRGCTVIYNKVVYEAKFSCLPSHVCFVYSTGGKKVVLQWFQVISFKTSHAILVGVKCCYLSFVKISFVYNVISVPCSIVHRFTFHLWLAHWRCLWLTKDFHVCESGLIFCKSGPSCSKHG